MDYQEMAFQNETGVSSATYNQLRQQVMKLSTVMNFTKEMVGNIETLNKTCSTLESNLTTIMEKTPQLEAKLHSIENKRENFKLMIQKLLKMKNQSDLCNLSIYDVQLFRKISPNETNIYEDKLENFQFPPNYTEDNPFFKIGKQFLAVITSQPFPLSISVNQDYMSVLKRYGRQCNFSIEFTSMLQPEGEGQRIEIILTWNESDHVVAGDVGTDCLSSTYIKNSMSKKLIMHFSKICKVIVKKKFEDLNCKRAVLSFAKEPVINIDVESSNEKEGLNFNDEIDSVVKADGSNNSNTKTAFQTIKPIAESYKEGANSVTKDITVIRNELVDIFNNYVKSDTLDDLIFMPEISLNMQAEIKSFIKKEYQPWLAPISFKYDEHCFLVLRKVVAVQKLGAILDANGGEIGPYKLILPGDLKDDDISMYSASPTAGGRMKLPDEQDNNSYNGDVLSEIHSQEPALTYDLDENKSQDLVNVTSFEFPPVIAENTPLPASLAELSFLRNYSIVIDDVPTIAHRAILYKFGSQCKEISFAVTVEQAETATETEPEKVEWNGSVVLVWMHKTFEIATTTGRKRRQTIEYVSKKALSVLSRICNVIVRNTCHQKKDNLIFISLGGVFYSHLYPYGTEQNQQNKFGTMQFQDYSDEPPASYNDQGNWRGGYNTITGRKEKRPLTHKDQKFKAYKKLTRILEKYVHESKLKDLLFSPDISKEAYDFVTKTVRGKKYNQVLKIVKLTKKRKHYLSVMKIIRVQELTDILKRAGGQKDQYKLYYPRTLDLMTLWDKSNNKNSDISFGGDGLDDDLINPIDTTTRNVPPVKGNHSRKRKYSQKMDSNFQEGTSGRWNKRHKREAATYWDNNDNFHQDGHIDASEW